MIGLLIWLFFVIVGFAVLYAVIRAAVRDAGIQSLYDEMRTLGNQLNRQHEATSRQLEELKQLLIERGRPAEKESGHEGE